MGKATSDCAPWFVTVAAPTLKLPIRGGSVMLLGIPSENDANGSNPALTVVKSEMVLSFKRNLWGLVALVRESKSIWEVRLAARFWHRSSLTDADVKFVSGCQPDPVEIEKEWPMAQSPLLGILP